MSWRPSSRHLLTNGSSIFDMKNRQQPLSNLSRLCTQIRQRFLPLVNKPGVHSSILLKSAGFQYTGYGDTTRCEQCGLEVSNWTLDMNPWTVHSTQNPHCPFVRRLRADAFSNKFSSLSAPMPIEQNTSTAAEQENPSKRRKTEIIDLESPSNTSVEADLFQLARRNTFSDWPHRATPSIEDMIKAGFFACNVDDRVICIYCNIVCHQWTPHVDEPCEIHRAISPHCPYVREKLLSGEQPRIVNENQNSTGSLANNHLSTRNGIHSLQFSNLLRPPVQNRGNSNTSRSSTVSSEISIAEKIIEEFFYSRIKHDETCSDCKKSLQNMGPCDNQMVDFARWFVHCVHTKRFSADQIYYQIQQSKQAQQRGFDGILHTNSTTDDQQSARPNENTLSRLVAARLDLQIPQQLLNRNFSLSTLQRIWENELKLKDDDCISDVDLLMACIILQKQIDCIDGKKEKIETPGVKMRKITKQAEKEEAEKFLQRQATARMTLRDAAQARSENVSNSTGVEMVQSNDSTPSNPCVLCLTEEKRLACMPCGHLATCVPCGDSLQACPICRRKIDAFIRVYV